MKTIAIVGRPNVGKSRLFNRIIGRRRSIVDDQPGVTRDRVEEIARYGERRVRWIDTGGIGLSDDFAKMIELQAEVAIAAADAIVLVVDARAGVVPLDRLVVARLRAAATHRKPVLVAANKADDSTAEHGAADFAELGLGDVLPVSAEHGRGVSDLIEQALKLCGAEGEEDDEEPPATRIAIIGRPNVGKSSLLNAILRNPRAIVSEIPGTTRDAVEEIVERPGGRIAIVDTAGIRRKRSTFSLLENVMVGRTRHAVERSDVVVVVMDAAEGMTDQDVKIVAGVMALGKACVLAINKWDIAPSKEFDKVALEIRRRLKSEAHVPIVSISALKSLRIARLLDVAIEVARHAHSRIGTPELNRILADVARRAPGGLRIKYGVQRSILPPSFLIFGSGRPSNALLGFIRNSIRRSGDFDGVPIVLEFRR